MSGDTPTDDRTRGADAAIREHRFEDRDRLARSLAASVADSLYAAVASRPPGRLVVSGGSTPLPFFRRLRRLALPWHQVRLTLADERWVPPDHADSNERLVRAELLRDRAGSARWTPLWSAAESPEAAAADAEQRIAGLRPFDVVVLGMGRDGHTASLFPRAPELTEALSVACDRSCSVLRPPGDRRPRLTLTLNALLDSRRIALHITGAPKWRTYRRALAPGPIEALPIRAVLRHAANVDVYWSP